MTKYVYEDEYVKELAMESELYKLRVEKKIEEEITNPRLAHYVPVQSEYMDKFQQRMKELNDITRPVATNSSKKEVVNDLRDRIYPKLKFYINKYNQCSKKAIDVHANYTCSEQLIADFDNQVIPFARQVAKEF